ncbi:uncharacterized protein DS421_5g170750 [Arachis hypogaea]|nr:uncharacterized protein DS421_5g170750 [Arachis hypogaea]
MQSCVTRKHKGRPQMQRAQDFLDHSKEFHQAPWYSTFSLYIKNNIPMHTL